MDEVTSNSPDVPVPTRGRCAVCMSPHGVGPVHLSHGVIVQLCEQHDDHHYLSADGGRRFVRRLTEQWQAHGILNASRIKCLAAHLRRVRDSMKAHELPGSHAWAPERRECERRFAAGEPIAAVIDDIRRAERWHGRKPPSIRTIRRWYADGRWLAPPSPKHPVRDLIGKKAMDALIIAMEIGNAHAWEDWISRHGGPSPGQQRLRRKLQRE